MPDMIIKPHPVPAAWLTRMLRDEPVFTGAALVIALTMLPTLLAMTFDARLINLETPWIKPLKFQLSLTLYLGTLAFYARWLPEAMRKDQRYRAYTWVVVAAIAAESVWINSAAAFGTTSHFNVASPIMGAIYGLMGLLAVTLTTASAVYGIAIWRNPHSGLSEGMRVALGVSLGLTLPLTVITAGYMSMQLGHVVGTPVTHAALPLLGWSTEVGDLRAPHFFATHMMHVVPLAVLALGAGPPLARVLAFGYAILTAVIFVLTLLGLPLIPL